MSGWVGSGLRGVVAGARRGLEGLRGRAWPARVGSPGRAGRDG